MSGDPLSTLLDLPLVVASRAVDVVGEATARATRVASAPASAVRSRVEEVADDVGELVDDAGVFVDDGIEVIGDVSRRART